MSSLSFVNLLRIFNSQDQQTNEVDNKVVDGQRTKRRRLHTLPTNQSRQPSTRDLNNAIDFSTKRVVEVLLDRGIPGLTICVSKRNEIVWNTSFGYSDVENQVVCVPEARFRIGSISKSLFASTVIAPMLEKNQLSLDSSIHSYLTKEEFPRQKFENKEVDITVKQLLAHTSGVRHYDDDKSWTLKPIGSEGSLKVYQGSSQFDKTGFYQRETYRSVLEALEPIKDGKPLTEKPGTFSYSTYGYTLLSAVAEKIIQKNSDDQSGASENKRCHRQVEQFWMDVLKYEWKLAETELDYDEPIVPNRARYYLRTRFLGRLINAPYSDNSIKWAGGGIISTSRDLIKFANSLLDSYKNRGHAKLSRNTIELMWKEVEESYGLGFALRKLDRTESAGEEIGVFHTGIALGASSVLMIYPETEVAVAILTNLGYVDLEPLAHSVANEFANCTSPTEPINDVMSIVELE